MTIDVVVPYFDAPERLTSILLALNEQIDPVTGSALDDLRVVVADDASTVAPVTSSSRHPLDVVRLDETGYHAATARNRGASAGNAPVIVFLDGDTVPSPTYVSTLCRPIVDGSAGLTTGRRRHADLAGLDPTDVADFVADPDPARLLGEPQWLTDGIGWTDSLRSASPDVFQYVISAVLAVDRRLFDEVGGFDDDFDSYGGEDWEFAYRCWNAGGDFLHVPAAVAFHDGPDVEGRDPDPVAKTIENLRIVDLVPASPTRLAGVRYSVPDIDIGLTLRPGDIRSNAMSVLSILDSAHSDLRIRLLGSPDDTEPLLLLIRDERVVAGDTSAHPSSRWHVVVSAPLVLVPSALGEMCADLTDATSVRRRIRIGDATVDAWSVRAMNRARRDGCSDTEDPEAIPAEHLGESGSRDQDVAAWSRRRRRGQSA